MRKSVVPYRVYYIDKRLNIVPLKTIHHTGHLLARKDGLEEGGEFILGDSTTDQALPGLIIRVESDGQIGGRDWIHIRYSPLQNTSVFNIEQMVGGGWCGETSK
jgi:hypothetical protein